MRIQNHPIKSFAKGGEISFEYNGEKVIAYEGETIAAALHAAGYKLLTKSRKHSRPRGLFCAIGKCSACLMEVNGIPNIAICTTKAKQGMKVYSNAGGESFDRN